MTGLGKRSRPCLYDFEFRALGFGLTRYPQRETQNYFSVIAAGSRSSVNNFYQSPKGRPGF